MNKVKTTAVKITIANKLLEGLDAFAFQHDLSRSTAISILVAKLLDYDIKTED